MGKQNGKQIDGTIAYRADNVSLENVGVAYKADVLGTHDMDGDYDGDTVGQLASTQVILNAKSDPNFKLENFGKVGDDAYKRAQAALGTHDMDGDYDGDTVGQLGPKF